MHSMTQPMVRQLDLPKKIWLGLATVVAIAAPVLFGLATGTGQSAAPQSADAANETFSYEVASIKPEKSGSRTWLGVRPTPDGLIARSTLLWLIRIAYGIPFDPLGRSGEDDQISGAPGWVNSEKYDIEAKMDPATAEKMKKLDEAQKSVRSHRMLQTLLADRFKLTIHRETKVVPIYLLVVAKGGPKLHEAKSGDPYSNGIKG